MLQVSWYAHIGRRLLPVCLLVIVGSVYGPFVIAGWDQMKREMIDRQIAARGVKDPRVLAALHKVDRHLFVPERHRQQSYVDHPLPIGEGQTISQPYIVAYMTEALGLQGGEKVLEIGTGSGYQAAILAEVVGREGKQAGKVYSIEIVPSLAKSATKLLQELQYTNVFVKEGDGYLGWPEHAPFDAIMVTAAPEQIPKPLIEQLKVGGRLIIPVGRFMQQLKLITKKKSGVRDETLLDVRFVPMTGRAMQDKP